MDDNNITIDDNYIQEMLKQYPLMQENNPVDLRDYTLDMVAELANEENNIPNEFYINYNPIVRKIKQKNIGACVSCATTGAIMIMKNCDKLLSWWFLHADRDNDDWQGQGYFIRQALQHVKDDGITLLDLFNIMQNYPDIKDALMNNPNKDEIFKEASKNKIGGYIKVEKKDVKRLVSQGIPVLIGVKVYSNFYEAVNNNYIIPNVPMGSFCGNHEILITGYDSENKVEILNWWDGIWDHDLYLDLDSDIIIDYYIITDAPIKRPIVKIYKIGWDKDFTGKWIYSEDGIKLVKDCWKQIKGVWYYFKDIYAVDGDWVQYKGCWYYMNKGSCAMYTSKWILWKDKWYYLRQDGVMCTNCYTPDGYFVDPNGAWNKSIPKKL